MTNSHILDIYAISHDTTEHHFSFLPNFKNPCKTQIQLGTAQHNWRFDTHATPRSLESRFGVDDDARDVARHSVLADPCRYHQPVHHPIHKEDYKADERKWVEKVLNPLSSQIEAFKQNVPLIIKMRLPGIKTNHWEMISEVVSFKVSQLKLSRIPWI